MRRWADRTELLIHGRKRLFRGTGPVAVGDSLRPKDLARRILSPDSRLLGWWQGLGYLRGLDRVDGTVIAGVLRGLLALGDEGFSLQAGGSPDVLLVTAGDVRLRISSAAPRRRAANPTEDTYVGTEVDRSELERSILSGVRRAGEVLFPGRSLLKPRQQERTVPGGKLTFAGPLRVVTLAGTPEEVGRAHGLLLATEARRAIASTLCLAGLGYTIDRGEWFPSVLRDAWKRLAPHIPKDHLAEMDAMADAIGIDRETVRLANVFPELFHCSGFAVFGDGDEGRQALPRPRPRLHDDDRPAGRGAVFVVAVDGQARLRERRLRRLHRLGDRHERATGLPRRDGRPRRGELGRRADGDADAPGAGGMRHPGRGGEALAGEPADLRVLLRLRRRQDPGRGRGGGDAGVASSVLEAGADHDLLGQGIPDAVVLSAGGRLEELRRRILARPRQDRRARRRSA